MSVLSELKPNLKKQHFSYSETKSGIFIYDGAPSLFAEWAFRTRCRYLSCKEDEKPQLACKVIEGLHGQAFTLARSFTDSQLVEKDAVINLIAKIKSAVFPHLKQEAKVLYRAGHERNGTLTRQRGEPMVMYIDRRTL